MVGYKGRGEAPAKVALNGGDREVSSRWRKAILSANQRRDKSRGIKRYGGTGRTATDRVFNGSQSGRVIGTDIRLHHGHDNNMQQY